jgi:hypothetical protein
MTKIFYKIIYKNGVTQVKNLIEHIDYETVIKPKLVEIYELEVLKKDREASIIKKELKETFGENYFTDKSPLYYGIETGILSLLPQQGGDHSVNITKN